jgi:hypothetical protein
MRRGTWVLGIVGIIGLSFATTGRADDTIKLDLKSNDAVQTKNLLGDGGAETVEVHGWRCWRPWCSVWVPRCWSSPVVAWYSPVVSIPVVRRHWCNWVSPSPIVYINEPSVAVAPGGLNLRVPFVSLNIARSPRVAVPQEAEPIAAPRRAMPKPNDGTFQYDGGPANPVPMPQVEPAPSRAVPVIPEGRVVSITPKSPKYSYSAYGEKPESRLTEQRQLAAKSGK